MLADCGPARGPALVPWPPAWPWWRAGESISRWMAAESAGAEDMGDQLSPSGEMSSFPRSCPSPSILMTTPSSNGPNTFPLRRRTCQRATRPEGRGLGATGPWVLAASSMKLSISRPSAGPEVAGGGMGAERSASSSSRGADGELLEVGSNSSGSTVVLAEDPGAEAPKSTSPKLEDGSKLEEGSGGGSGSGMRDGGGGGEKSKSKSLAEGGAAGLGRSEGPAGEGSSPKS